MKEATVPATVENLERVLRLIDEALEGYGISGTLLRRIHLAAEEIFVNIARYAYSPGSGEVTVRCGAGGSPPHAAIEFSDRGLPFDPLGRAAPDLHLPADRRPVGGLGIFLTRELMDEVHYAYREGQNVLTLVKRLDR